MPELTELSSHFRFGENWLDYARGIDESRISQAQADLERLLGPGSVADRSFLDLGCGSGIHALAALRLGAARVLAVDLDPESVAAATATLTTHAPDGNWECRELSVFAADPTQVGTFDIVYSWGVLHHTGNMWAAIENAVALVKPGGLFVLAIYLKTPFCGFWRWEKRIYARSPRLLQSAIRSVYGVLALARVATRGRSPVAYVRSYRKRRGMSFRHDVHDWLGGYPYESASSDEIERFMAERGLPLRAAFNTRPNIGLFGSGCAEYVFSAGPPDSGVG